MVPSQMAKPKPCLFCPKPRTNKRGEHIFDDWLNRLNGKTIDDRYEFRELDATGAVVKTFTRRTMDTTRRAVCDTCNSGWMSDLTNEFKKTAGGIIRFDRPTTMLPLGLATLSAFTFMKAAVVDDYHATPLVLRAWCLAFADTLEMPLGTQVWCGRFRTTHRMATRAFSTTARVNSGRWFGYQSYVFTYAIGNLALQISIPRRTKWAARDTAPPFFIQKPFWDVASIPIWPDIDRGTWPPPNHLTDESLKLLRDRFGAGDMLARRDDS